MPHNYITCFLCYCSRGFLAYTLRLAYNLLLAVQHFFFYYHFCASTFFKLTCINYDDVHVAFTSAVTQCQVTRAGKRFFCCIQNIYELDFFIK